MNDSSVETPPSNTEPNKTETAPESGVQPKPAVAPEKPSAAAPAPAAAAEPAFNVDVLLSCTARFTHKAWGLFYSNRQNMDYIRRTPVSALLTARSDEGAAELAKTLNEAGVATCARQGKTLQFTGTFEQIQTVIKQPETYLLDLAS